MKNSFGITDTFIEAVIGIDGSLFVWKLTYPYSLDTENYFDRKTEKTIRATFCKVETKITTLWITGNVLELWQGKDKRERAINFASWYENAHMKKYVLD